jgi:hypothetical protein
MRKPPSISVMTRPVPMGRYAVTVPLRRIARLATNLIRPGPAYWRSRYGGHFAVTRSMAEGLQKIGVSSNYNPAHMREVGEVVVVPGGFAALEQALEWRRMGVIRRLLAGPNLVDFPSERRGLMCAGEIDLLLVPCDWVRDNFVTDCPELDGRVVAWPAGVDVSYWSPDQDRPRDVCLVYEKQIATRERVGPISDYIPAVSRLGYEVEILRYGTYLQDQYRHVLRRSALLVGFVLNETQGLAWAEAWSTDVPTILWRQDSVTFKSRTYRSSTAPYLSSKTGVFFDNVATLEIILRDWGTRRMAFQPRSWVLENMSDEACARVLCRLANVPINDSRGCGVQRL